MDQLSVAVSGFVSSLEDLRLPYISSSNYIKAIVVGIPVAVLAHDLAGYWMPEKFRLPILSWFTRRWRADPATKFAHLRVIRNLVLFALFVVLHNESSVDKVSAVAEPSQLVDERLLSAAATRSMNSGIYKARRAAFAAADEVIGEEEMNSPAVQQQIDTVLRRRYIYDSRAQSK